MSQTPNEFEKVAREHRSASLLGEFLLFLAENRKWWLLPILGVLLLFGVIVLLSSSAAAPFIYTLF